MPSRCLPSSCSVEWVPQEPLSFDPSLCTKVIPVYIRNSSAPAAHTPRVSTRHLMEMEEHFLDNLDYQTIHNMDGMYNIYIL